jgi:hypothetical protein
MTLPEKSLSGSFEINAGFESAVGAVYDRAYSSDTALPTIPACGHNWIMGTDYSIPEFKNSGIE